jgi:hypothetical protein
MVQWISIWVPSVSKYYMGINEFLTLAGGNLFCILGFVHTLASRSSYLRHIALCHKTKVHYFDLLFCDQLWWYTTFWCTSTLEENDFIMDIFSVIPCNFLDYKCIILHYAIWDIHLWTPAGAGSQQFLQYFPWQLWYGLWSSCSFGVVLMLRFWPGLQL